MVRDRYRAFELFAQVGSDSHRVILLHIFGFVLCVFVGEILRDIAGNNIHTRDVASNKVSPFCGHAIALVIRSVHFAATR